MTFEYSEHAPRYAVVDDEDYEWEAEGQDDDNGARLPSDCLFVSPSWNAPTTSPASETPTLLLVAASDSARLYVKASLRLGERVAVITTPSTSAQGLRANERAQTKSSLNSDSSFAGSVYTLRNDRSNDRSARCYVVMSESTAADAATLIAKSLIDVFKPTNTVVLDTVAPVDFLSDDMDQVGDRLRSLKTSAAGESVCPPLQPPTVIQGLSAALASACERKQLPAHVYLTVSEPHLGRRVVPFDVLIQYDRVLDALSVCRRKDAAKSQQREKNDSESGVQGERADLLRRWERGYVPSVAGGSESAFDRGMYM